MPNTPSTSRISFVLDTGFTDYLTLPANVIASLKLEFFNSWPVTLADGSQTMVDVFLAYVLWHHDQWVPVNVFSTEGGPLIGMSLLCGFRVALDVVDGGELSISPIA